MPPQAKDGQEAPEAGEREGTPPQSLACRLGSRRRGSGAVGGRRSAVCTPQFTGRCRSSEGGSPQPARPPLIPGTPGGPAQLFQPGPWPPGGGQQAPGLTSELASPLPTSPVAPTPRSVSAVRTPAVSPRTASSATSPDAWSCAADVPSRTGPTRLLHAIPCNGPPCVVLRDGRTLRVCDLSALTGQLE